MSETIVRDVLVELDTLDNCNSEDLDGLNDLRGATVADVFVSRNEVTVHAIRKNGAKAVVVFVTEGQDLRKKIPKGVHPGGRVLAALRNAI